MFRNSSKHISSVASAKFLTGVIALLLTIAGLTGGVARAQLAGKGAIKGSVKDPSGAVLETLTVTATNVTTAISTTQATNASGDFELSPS